MRRDIEARREYSSVKRGERLLRVEQHEEWNEFFHQESTDDEEERVDPAEYYMDAEKFAEVGPTILNNRKYERARCIGRLDKQDDLLKLSLLRVYQGACDKADGPAIEGW